VVNQELFSANDVHLTAKNEDKTANDVHLTAKNEDKTANDVHHTTKNEDKMGKDGQFFVGGMGGNGERPIYYPGVETHGVETHGRASLHYHHPFFQ
jgi:hypothetical protein